MGDCLRCCAWTLLQGTGELPARPITLALAVRQMGRTGTSPLGLLFVPVLAWYHGDRGEQRVSRPELAILVTIVAFRCGTLWWYVSRIDQSAWSPTPA